VLVRREESSTPLVGFLVFPNTFTFLFPLGVWGPLSPYVSPLGNFPLPLRSCGESSQVVPHSFPSPLNPLFPSLLLHAPPHKFRRPFAAVFSPRQGKGPCARSGPHPADVSRSILFFSVSVSLCLRSPLSALQVTCSFSPFHIDIAELVETGGCHVGLAVASRFPPSLSRHLVPPRRTLRELTIISFSPVEVLLSGVLVSGSQGFFRL